MSDDTAEVDVMMRRAIGGDEPAIAWVTARADASRHPGLLALAGVLADRTEHVMAAKKVAASTRDRQMVAIAAAHLRGEADLVDALARDHLVDHPDSVLVAWIAGGAGRRRPRIDGPKGP